MWFLICLTLFKSTFFEGVPSSIDLTLWPNDKVHTVSFTFFCTGDTCTIIKVLLSPPGNDKIVEASGNDKIVESSGNYNIVELSDNNKTVESPDDNIVELPGNNKDLEPPGNDTIVD